ncbi:MAG: FKBP-type peptidyl-prolyl cis-trans isomerase [Paramuribaculum sp.]|nr:FKBP-type peptidyl-prolyl cis-trans isomerase [Paramuribaculum sp.]
MKKLLYIVLLAAVAIPAVVSCGSDNNWEDYKDWREANNTWYEQQVARTNPDGTPYFTAVSPAWLPNNGVLIHYFNDRKETEGELSPYITSTVAVKYKGHLYDGTGFDSTAVSGADTVRTFPLSGVVKGWQVALTDMRVGDTAEVVIPFPMGYGETGSNSILPYSALRFGIKLVDIPSYEIR